ncbi:unnamed protein product [Prorocentrum cordatum]|uniref:Uncharacterized protein n=1 Tax=Prorocentrum cordatum TaxID=2364126 RepID=A0ABN9Y7K6_9DINO|nr:unnamed protein product [Polarella glacialis]
MAVAAARGAHHHGTGTSFFPPAGGAEARCRSWWLCGAPDGWRRARQGPAAAAPPRREAARGPRRRAVSRAAGALCPPSVAPSCLKGRMAAREGGSCVPGPARVRRAASMPAGVGGGSPRSSPTGPAEGLGAWPAGPPRLRRAASTAGEEHRRRHDSRVKRVLFLPCLVSSTHEVTPYAQKYGIHPRFFVFEKNGDKRLTDSGIKEDIKRIEQGLGPLKLGRRQSS